MRMDFDRNSKGFIGAMKTLAEDERHVDDAKDSYKEIKTRNQRPINIRCSRNRKNRGFTKFTRITIY